MAILQFDATAVEPASAFDPLPPGRYEAVITESNMRPTKSGKGSYLQLTFQIVSGDFKGRKVWSRLNLDNPSAQAVQIAKAELSAICRAVGVLKPADSTELHNLPLVIAVKQVTTNAETTNEVKGYYKREASVPAQPAADWTPPWKK